MYVALCYHKVENNQASTHPMLLVFQLLILIFSVVIHEVSHGYAARALGDMTAEYAGRLTLNPLKHLDIFGSFIVPLLCYITGGFIIGWAKPVPYNPYNLRNRRWGELWVALAGPLSNIVVALGFSAIIRFVPNLPDSFLDISSLIVYINILLAIFNMVPVPPLDGSKIIFALLPYRFQGIRNFLERYSLFLALIFVFFLWGYVSPIVAVIFHLFTGLS